MQKLETAYFSPEVGSIGLEREPRVPRIVRGVLRRMTKKRLFELIATKFINRRGSD